MAIPHRTTAGRRPGRCSIRATWRAMRAIPVNHFPLILPGVHRLASFFILWRLKGLGFSGCRVVTTDSGLVVHAHR